MIDEKKLIEELEKIFETDEENIDCTLSDFAYHVFDCIKAQPKIGEWIPCSEQLPEMHREDMESEGEYYMISDSVIITDGENIGITKYEVDDDDRKGWLECEFERNEDVVAWKPLPEPYNPGMIRKQTNADRIRAMTDEDLAINMMCPNENGLAEIDCDK